MSKATLLAIDQGTTSSRAILFSEDGQILSLAQKELDQHYPQKGWVEHDANDIWRDTLSVCQEVFHKSPEEAVRCAAVGITNQRETTILWERSSGKPLYHAIVWQDRRTADFCSNLLQKRGQNELVKDKTGLLIDPYFSCSKIRWLLDNIEGARNKAERGELAFGTVDCFLLWKLTNGKVHATDATNAARTGLFNIQTQKWDDELLALYDVPLTLLPEVKDNAAEFGQIDKQFLGRSLPVSGMAGDQHAALIGQACFEPGMMKSTYGTGCFALMNIGKEFKKSENKLLTTPAYRLNGQVTFAIEGSIFVAGAAVQWLRDNLEILEHASDSQALAETVSDNNGVYFVPAFTGLAAPWWDPDAKALIAGLSRESNKAHIVRAALEAQAYQTRDLMEAMKADTKTDPAVLRADGGLVSNQFVCQFLADILQIPIQRPKITETTALGAAYLAGLQAGVYQDLDAIGRHWREEKKCSPQRSQQDTQKLYQGWLETLQLLTH